MAGSIRNKGYFTDGIASTATAAMQEIREQKRLRHHLQMYAPMGEKKIARVSLVVDGVITLLSRSKNDSFFDFLLPNDLITY